MSTPFRVELTAPVRLFDASYSWAQPRLGAIPPGQSGHHGTQPLVVMTMQTIQLDRSDYFSGLFEVHTDDLGQHWSQPLELPTFARLDLGGGREKVVCDFTPRWHSASGRLIGTGHTAYYQGGHVAEPRPRETAYAFYDAAARSWHPWKTLAMPDEPCFIDSGAGSSQWVESPEGDLLLPISLKPTPESPLYGSTVVRCRVEGDTLVYHENGPVLTVPEVRGLYEPSITRYNGRYYLTLRNDLKGYVAVSDDGLHFSDPIPWCWDDGSDLGNYNTQQHWITHPRHGLYLAYTRRGADNDHVMRHRAPLFMAQVDPATLRVLRETEVILMPNRGARLGNFAVAEVSDQETWVSDAEWMQPHGCEKYGSDGSVWVTRIHWDA